VGKGDEEKSRIKRDERRSAKKSEEGQHTREEAQAVLMISIGRECCREEEKLRNARLEGKNEKRVKWPSKEGR